MDRYQEFFLMRINICKRTQSKSGGFDYTSFNRSGDFTIEQKQYGVNDVELVIIVHGEQTGPRFNRSYIFPTFLTGVYISYDGERFEELTDTISDSGNSKIYATSIDFNNPVKFIKLTIEENMADDIVLPIQTIAYGEERHQKEMDDARRAQEKEMEKQRQIELLKNAAVECSKGQSLINVYFQPCCKEYEYTEIILFKEERLLEKVKVVDKFYHAFINLAYGRYAYVVKQYDKNSKLLLETDKKEVVLSNGQINYATIHPNGPMGRY